MFGMSRINISTKKKCWKEKEMAVNYLLYLKQPGKFKFDGIWNLLASASFSKKILQHIAGILV